MSDNPSANLVFSHYEQDLSDVFNSIENSLSQLEFDQINPGGLSSDSKLVYVQQTSDYIEEAEEITQQLEFSFQNSGVISQNRPKITNFNSQIQEFVKRLEKITGEKKQQSLTNSFSNGIGSGDGGGSGGENQSGSGKKIRFDDIHINVKDDLDEYEEEEDLDDIRKQKTPMDKFKHFMKYHAIKVLVIFIVALTIILLAYYAVKKSNKNNPDETIH